MARGESKIRISNITTETWDSSADKKATSKLRESWKSVDSIVFL